MAPPLHLQFDCCNGIQLTVQIITCFMIQCYTWCSPCPDIPRCALTVSCHILCLWSSITLVMYTNCKICRVWTQGMLVFAWLSTSSAVFKLRDLKVVEMQIVVSLPKNTVRWVPHLSHPLWTISKCTLVYPLCRLYLPPTLVPVLVLSSHWHCMHSCYKLMIQISWVVMLCHRKSNI
jgi:hypothetical protein